MSLYNEWLPAEATFEIAGRMTNVRFPSKVQMKALINHVATNFNVGVLSMSNNNDAKYIVNVGANVGGMSLLFHLAFPEAKILALEPMSFNYRYLVYNTQHFPNIYPKKLAAFNQKGELRLSMPSSRQRADIAKDFRCGNSGLFSAYGEDHDHSEYVACDLLDDIVEDKVDLLKMDIEGGELAALEGAKRIITKDRPIIIIELRETNLAMAGNTIKDYEHYFESAGYRQVGTYRGDVILAPKEARNDT